MGKVSAVSAPVTINREFAPHFVVTTGFAER
jgi:hypothetical protein